MKRIKIVCFVVLLMTFQSCNSKKENVEPAPQPQSQWEVVELKGYGAVYSIYGSIEDRLLLGTSSAIIELTDNGKVSREIFKYNEYIADIRVVNDTIYAISNFKTHYSSDNGETWGLSTKQFELYNRRELIDSKGILYYHVTPTNGELALPGLILRSVDKGINWENIFPFKGGVSTPYLDSKDRLYLVSIDAEWNGLSFVGGTNNALLYYQKK